MKNDKGLAPKVSAGKSKAQGASSGNATKKASVGPLKQPRFGKGQ